MFHSGSGSELAHRVSGDQVTLDVEGVVDRGVGGEEPLGEWLALEELLLALSSPDRQVGVFDPIVLPESARAMDMVEAEFSKRRPI